ncbi:MAG: glycosyltransferase family 2 protein [Alphaproteobacteria bacterium]
MPGPVPLVTIAIPASRDHAALEVALRSAAAQDYPNLEILTLERSVDPDAAPSDLAEDSRISVLQPNRPLSAVASRQFLLGAATGEFFMWLAPGDWLDPDFVSACARLLNERTDHVAVAGRQMFHDEAGEPQESPSFSVTADQAQDRVEEFLSAVVDMGGYWLFRRSAIADVPLREALGYEFGLFTEAAFKGKIAIQPATASHREGNPNLESFADVAVKLGVSAYQAEDPYLMAAAILFCDIVFLRPAYGRLAEGERLRLASRAFTIIGRRWTILNALHFMSFASRIFPQERIGERMRILRRRFATFLMTGEGDGYIGLPMVILVDMINVLCRIGLGKMPPAKDETDTLARLSGAWEGAATDDRRNRLLMAMALYV